MTQIYKSILSDIEIHEILSCPEIIKAKTCIDNKSSRYVSFDIRLTNKIKTILLEKMGISLTGDRLPMLWINGDSPQHVDIGVECFENTYLIYLMDSKGEFIINDVSHPILKGCGFSFNEGIPHETINTGSTPRLLLGPMSEKGFRVLLIDEIVKEFKNISALVGKIKQIDLGSTNNPDIEFILLSDPKYGSLTRVSNGVYNYLSSENKVDRFTYIVREKLEDIKYGTVIINNYSQTDIDNIPRTMGTFTFDNISFDGDIWTFGTMSSEIFIEFPEFFQFGNWQFYNTIQSV